MIVASALLALESGGARRCSALGPSLLLADWFGAMGWGTDALAAQRAARGPGVAVAAVPTVAAARPGRSGPRDARAARPPRGGGRVNAALEVALTPAQQAVIDAIGDEDQSPLLVTGRAGTGKSTVLHRIVAVEQRKVAVVAPTGVAALNVGGQTIHSFLRLPVGLIGNSRLYQDRELRKLLGRSTC